MFTLVSNGILIDPLNSKVIENGAILYDNNGIILEVGENDSVRKKAFELTEETKELHLKVIDVKKRVILPGLVCAHHHFYSSFVRGLILSGQPPKNFLEILKSLWWKLDRLLSQEEIFYSALVAAIDCLKSGITTVIDHHESQGYQIGSLDEIEKAVAQVGLRACLCLGASDRYGKGKEGLEEIERFLKKTQSPNYLMTQSLISGMVGLHASFTVNDDTLSKAVELAKKYNTGIHIHCAEDLSDEDDSIKQYNLRVVERLAKFGALNEKSILAHCVHIDDKELDLIKEYNANVVLNSESNMNNAVGCANAVKMLNKGITVGLGTDGMSSNMLQEARVFFLIQRHNSKNPSVCFGESGEILFKGNAKIVEKIFGRKYNLFECGVLADVVVYDYIPPTELNSENFLGHLLFGVISSKVDTVIVNGKILLQEGKIQNFSEYHLLQEAKKVATHFWKKFEAET